ncbi:MAG: DUF4870 domain-containing protein [Thermoanaerobaculia bacterium]
MSEMPPPNVPPGTPPPPSGGSYAPPPPPPPPPPGSSGSSDRTLMLVLSYLGILALIPLLVRKDDREVQWHAKNGLAMFIAYFVVMIVLWILEWVFRSGCVIGAALGFINCIVGIGYLVVIIMGIVKATKGERFRLPVVSDFADKM